MNISKLIDPNYDESIDILMTRIGKKNLKLLHTFEYMLPSSDPAKIKLEFSDGLRAIAKDRMPELFQEEILAEQEEARKLKEAEVSKIEAVAELNTNEEGKQEVVEI